MNNYASSPENRRISCFDEVAKPQPGTVQDLYNLLCQYAPARTVILVPNSAAKHWVSRQLAGYGPVVGAEVSDIQSFLNKTAGDAMGDPVDDDDITRLILDSFRDHPMFSELFRLESKGTVLKSWVDGIRQHFVELHRTLDEREPQESGLQGRDLELLHGFVKFRAKLNNQYPSAWWAGNAPVKVLKYAHDLPAVRDLKNLILFGFSTNLAPDNLSQKPSWLSEFLNAICNLQGLPTKKILEITVISSGQLHQPAKLFACKNPESEIAVVARLIRRKVQPTAIFVPSTEVGRWTARLQHRDIPVCSWVPQPMSETAVIRMLKALVNVTGGGLVHKSDMTEVLFGSALRPISWAMKKVSADEDEIQFAIYPLAKKCWAEIRRRNQTIAQWRQQLDVLINRRIKNWAEADEKTELTSNALNRREKEKNAIKALCMCLDLLTNALDSIPAISDLLTQWGIYNAAAANSSQFGLEKKAVDKLMQALLQNFIQEGSVSVILEKIYGELDLHHTGYWVEQRTATGGTVSIVPYEAACIDLPERVIMCGLDAMPRPVSASSFFSTSALEKLGVASDLDRYACDCNRLNRLLEHENRVVSWRTKDFRGGACNPSAWTMTNVADYGSARPVGVDSVALPRGDNLTATCLLESDILLPENGLAARIAAIGTHFDTKNHGPWSGELGVKYIPATHSVSALQSYVRMPYKFYLCRVLGIKEDEEAEDALDAAEHGTIIHAALEKTSTDLLKTGDEVDVVDNRDSLISTTNEAIKSRFSNDCNQILAGPVWTGDQNRWITELGYWWDEFYGRITNKPSHELADVEACFKPLLDESFDTWVEDYKFQEVKTSLDKVWELLSTNDFGYTDGVNKTKILKSDIKKIIDWVGYCACSKDPGWLEEAKRKEVGTRSSTLRKVIDYLTVPELFPEDAGIDEKWKNDFPILVNGLKKKLRKELQKFRLTIAALPGTKIVAAEMPLGTADKPLRIELTDKLPIFIKGSIDRVEIDVEKKRINICDYKSGRAKTANNLAIEIAAGEHLQLPLYAVAVDSMPDEMKPGFMKFKVGAFRLEFLRRNDNGKNVLCALNPDDVIEGTSMTYIDAAKYRAAQIVTNIQNGHFPLSASSERVIESDRESEVLRVVYISEPTPLPANGTASNDQTSVPAKNEVTA